MSGKGKNMGLPEALLVSYIMCSRESGLPNFLGDWMSNVASWGHERNFSSPPPSTEGWKGREITGLAFGHRKATSLGGLRDKMHLSFLSKSCSGKRLNYSGQMRTAVEGTRCATVLGRWLHVQSLGPQVKLAQRLGPSCLSWALTVRRTAYCSSIHRSEWSQPCSIPIAHL